MEKKKFPGKVTPYLFILPWIIGFIVFTAGPLILSLVMSFFDWPITSTPTFRGLGNYVEMFTKDKQFYKSLVITLKYAAIFVPLNMIIALFLAMLITQPVKGVKIYRTIFYIPAVVSGVAISIIWGWILNGNYGVLNYLLSLLGNRGPQLAGRSFLGASGRYSGECVWRRNHDADFLYGYQEYSHRSIRGGFLRRCQSGETVLFHHAADYHANHSV